MGAARRLCTAASPLVLIEQRGRVAVLRLNRPASLNAMTAEMGDAFAAAVGSLSARCDELGAVVVIGAGKAFSAGGDMQFLHERARDSPWRNSQVMRRFYERFLSIRKLPIPTVAAINGGWVHPSLPGGPGCSRA
jgi:enoyl-CoA hydratase/carnithine racemase